MYEHRNLASWNLKHSPTSGFEKVSVHIHNCSFRADIHIYFRNWQQHHEWKTGFISVQWFTMYVSQTHSKLLFHCHVIKHQNKKYIHNYPIRQSINVVPVTCNIINVENISTRFSPVIDVQFQLTSDFVQCQKIVGSHIWTDGNEIEC